MHDDHAERPNSYPVYYTRSPADAAGSEGAAADRRPRMQTAQDHFLKLMFFQASRNAPDDHEPWHPPASGAFAALRHSSGPGQRYVLPLPNTAATVTLDSPALEVMTDLRRVEAVTVERLRTLAEARAAMIAHRVRALFVTEEGREVEGIVTATDLHGELPIRLAQARGVRYDEVLVRDVMTPAERLEVLDLEEVARARVGDVVATLKMAGRQHALAVEAAAAPVQCVRGIFSLTQIARQLGVAAQDVHDIARTFAEIEAALGS
jgi:CBS domain-containing protein